jgi:NTP pyrophosphatase (non-canonical NTP hydrolase)
VNYVNFVNAVTSLPSQYTKDFTTLLHKLDSGVPISRLLTAAIGMSSEAAEFMELESSYSQDTKHKLIELGDILWYVAQGALALNLDMPAPSLNASTSYTASVSLVLTSGKFLELVKKLVFQGKPWSLELRQELTSLLEEVATLVEVAAQGLGHNSEEVKAMNVTKLQNRYPEGFDAYMSENRKIGDL